MSGARREGAFASPPHPGDGAKTSPEPAKPVVTAPGECANEACNGNHLIIIRSADMGEYKHGDMNTFVQEKTFEGFIKFVTRTVIVIAVLLLFIAAVNG